MSLKTQCQVEVETVITAAIVIIAAVLALVVGVMPPEVVLVAVREGVEAQVLNVALVISVVVEEKPRNQKIISNQNCKYDLCVVKYVSCQRPWRVDMRIVHHAFFMATILVTTGCANSAPPRVPATAARVPVNKSIPTSAAEPVKVAIVERKSVSISATEVPLFRGLDPDRLEALLRPSR